jgi:alpha-L-rhamnosidase
MSGDGIHSKRVAVQSYPHRQVYKPASGPGFSGIMSVDDDGRLPLFERGKWPASWIGLPGPVDAPALLAFRRRFAVSRRTRLRVHVTADERYELFLNGERIGRGPERGDLNSWFFDSYDWSLPTGEHTVVARVSVLGSVGPRAQMSLTPGFFLSPEGDEENRLLGTGVANWEVSIIDGYGFHRPFSHDFFSIGFNVEITGCRYPWGIEKGNGKEWLPVRTLLPGADSDLINRYLPTHLLRPAILPGQIDRPFTAVTARAVQEPVGLPDPAGVAVRGDRLLDCEAEDWEGLFRGDGPVTVRAGSARRVIVELGTYLCAYPEVSISGGKGGGVRLHWAESLFDEPDAGSCNKGRRDEVEGKFFSGVGDTFLPDGGPRRMFETFFWRSGRYLEVLVWTEGEDLTIEGITLRETRYPLQVTCVFTASDPRLATIIPMAIRTLEASAHDSFMDGPYFEQMMWVGDGVQTVLTHFVLGRDERLVKKSLQMFDSSRMPCGLTRARWPARDTMIIAPYSLYWVQMIHAFAFWRNDLQFVKGLMPGVRAVGDAFLRFLNRDGIVEISRGWNFVDWSPEWANGIPPGADGGVNAAINWQFVWVLSMISDLEEAVGEPELAARARRLAQELAERVESTFWDESRRLFSDDGEGRSFSEHAQCFAILSGFLSPERLKMIALLEDDSLTRATISFSHFLFEAYRAMGSLEAMFPRLNYWYELPKLGLITLPEGPEPTRSDCHCWGAHPVYHYFASILGIRPCALGFREVVIAPQLGPLTLAEGTLPHPNGEIVVKLEREEKHLAAQVSLPAGITGYLKFDGKVHRLHEGQQNLNLWRRDYRDFERKIRSSAYQT